MKVHIFLLFSIIVYGQFFHCLNAADTDSYDMEISSDSENGIAVPDDVNFDFLLINAAKKNDSFVFKYLINNYGFSSNALNQALIVFTHHGNGNMVNLIL